MLECLFYGLRTHIGLFDCFLMGFDCSNSSFSRGHLEYFAWMELEVEEDCAFFIKRHQALLFLEEIFVH